MEHLRGYQKRKQRLLAIYDAVLSLDGFLPVADRTRDVVEEKRAQLDQERFVLAVCGQMKAGKSTLLNALLFGGPVLPHDDLVMTAKNTLIRHGTSDGLEAHMYDTAEWNRLEEQLRRQPRRREEFSRACNLAAEHGALAAEQITHHGRTERREGWGDLLLFVGAVNQGGVFSPFVKEVVVFCERPLLREVEVADTPGVNDPNELREAITREWIGRADAVIYVTYAGRALDAQDVDFIDRHLLHVPPGRRVIAVNKMDCVSDPDEVRSWVEGLRGSSSPRLRSIFGDDGSVVYVSALGALLECMAQRGEALDEDLAEWHELLDRQGYIAPERHGLPDLDRLVVQRLMANKGDGLLASHEAFLDGLFELTERALRSEMASTLDELALIDCDDTELKNQLQNVVSAMSHLTGLGRRFRRERGQRHSEARERLRRACSGIRGRIEKKVKIRTEDIDNTSLLPTEFPWIVREAIDEQSGPLFEVLQRNRDAVEEELKNLAASVKTELLKEGGLGISEVDLLVDISLFDVVQRLEEKVRSEVGSEIVCTITKDSANFFQRLFDTDAGLKKIRSALADAMKGALESAFKLHVERAFAQALSDHTSSLEQKLERRVRGDLEKRKAAIEGLQREGAALSLRRAELLAANTAAEQRLGATRLQRQELGLGSRRG